MELIKIVNARNALERLADIDSVGAHLSYWMTKFVVKTSGEYDFYSLEMRKLIEKYAGQDGDKIVVSPDRVEEFNSAIESLNKTDAEDPGIRFKLSELSSELKLSMKQIYPLLDFIEEDK